MLIVASSAAVRADRGASAEPGAQAPPAVNAPPAQAHRQPKGPSALVGRVNVNTATAEQLALLPGLGPRRAAALIALRTRRPLRRTRDVTRVRGIGRRTWRRWRPFLAVSGETTLGRPRAGLTVLPTVPDSARGHPR